MGIKEDIYSLTLFFCLFKPMNRVGCNMLDWDAVSWWHGGKFTKILNFGNSNLMICKMPIILLIYAYYITDFKSKWSIVCFHVKI